MGRDERQQRIDELRRWIEEQNEEFRDEGFTAEVQEEWDRNNAELREHESVMAQLEARDATIRDLAADRENRENGADPGAVRSGRGAPVLVSRMSEDQVYDLSRMRFNPMQPERAAGELRDRARRALEFAHFPAVEHVGGDEGRAKAHVDKMLRRSDDEDWQGSELARRILVTGSVDYRKAFTKMMSASLRGMAGMANLTPSEMRAVEAMRALSVGTGASGGFAVPYQLDSTIIPTSNLSVNPYRAIGNVEQISGTNEWRGVTSGGVTAAYATEGTEASDNSPTLAQPTLTTGRAQCFVPVSIELTQDWGQIQQELAGLIQDAKDDLEATQFSTGTGTPPAPAGVITGATTTVATITAATFAVGDLYAMENALGPRFRPRAQWVANRAQYNRVRQFDTAGGANLWVYLAQGLQNNVPRGGNTGAELLGYAANECSALSATTVTAQKIAVLGDWRYFKIVDRIGMDIEVIPHLFGATNRFPTGQRGFYAFWRNTSKVLDANAFRTLLVA
jgi:HK97 family phage major capsid protein